MTAGVSFKKKYTSRLVFDKTAKNEKEKPKWPFRPRICDNRLQCSCAEKAKKKGIGGKMLICEDILENWNLETLCQYAEEQAITSQREDWELVLHYFPKPPVGWLVVRNTLDPKPELEEKDLVGKVLDEDGFFVVDEELFGPYMCEEDLVEDTEIYQSRSDERYHAKVFRTIALHHDDMGECLAGLKEAASDMQAEAAKEFREKRKREAEEKKEGEKEGEEGEENSGPEDEGDEKDIGDMEEVDEEVPSPTEGGDAKRQRRNEPGCNETDSTGSTSTIESLEMSD